MALRDYAEMDEDDFYGQGFEKARVVSVWLGLTDGSATPEGADVLQDLCGVGYYSLDDQEGNNFDFQIVPIAKLVADLSYSASFGEKVVSAAARQGITSARWILVQYDFKYDPSRVVRPIHDEPRFLGVFPYKG